MDLLRPLALGAALTLAACSSAPANPSPSTGPVAGTYTSVAFAPAVTFDLPAGWEIGQDSTGYLLLRPAGSEVAGIHLFRDPKAAVQDEACSAAADPAVGATSAALSVWMRERPGLVVSSPALVTLDGLRGVMLDIGISADWKASCPFAEGLPTVPFIAGPTGYHWVIAGAERLRVWILDLPAGGTLMIDIDDFSGQVIDDLLVDATPIVGSMTFAD